MAAEEGEPVFLMASRASGKMLIMHRASRTLKAGDFEGDDPDGAAGGLGRRAFFMTR